MIRTNPFCLISAVALALGLAACSGPSTSPTPATGGGSAAGSRREAIAQLIATQGSNPSALADAVLARLSLEQKVGQVLVIGFDGPTYDRACRDLIEKRHIGGVILFARNIESPAQTARLTNELQASALASNGLGLLIAIDQEGGRVARLTTAKGFTEFPGAMALGATSTEEQTAAALVRRTGEAMAREMRAVGINVDFAPDLDVNNNPANPVIGVRSYGSDPKWVAALGRAFAEGLQSQGVLAFGKHFPGHGDTGTDSHVSLPVVAHARERLESVEFVPFKAAIAGGIAGIMSAHISFPTIEPKPGLPATLSGNVLTGLLREELRYDGLVVTDSLEMGALAKSGYPAERAAMLALAAGADLLLFNAGHDLHEAAHREIVAAVMNGLIPQARLDQAVRRVLLAKAKQGLLQPNPVDPTQAEKVTGAAAHRALAAELTQKALTVVRDERKLLPLAVGQPPLVIAVPAAKGLAAALAGKEVAVSDRPTSTETASALAAIQAQPGTPVILTLSGASANRAQAGLAKAVLATGAQVILIALREPYDLMPTVTGATAAAAPTLIATYGYQPSPIAALAALLQGKTKPSGHLPVELPGVAVVGTGEDAFRRR